MLSLVRLLLIKRISQRVKRRRIIRLKSHQLQVLLEAMHLAIVDPVCPVETLREVVVIKGKQQTRLRVVVTTTSLSNSMI